MKALLIPKMRVLMQMCCAAKQRRNMPANPPTRLFPVTPLLHNVTDGQRDGSFPT